MGGGGSDSHLSPGAHHLGETRGRDRHCFWDRFVRLIGQQQAKDKLWEAGFDWLTQILAGREVARGEPGRGSPAPNQAGEEGSPSELQPRVNEILSSYPLRIISDSDLKGHLRTFARHPGIALGFSHKIHHPNASLFFTVQYNPPFFPT